MKSPLPYQIKGFLLFFLIFFQRISFSQNISDTAKIDFQKICQSEDNPKLKDILTKQQVLAEKISNLQSRQQRFVIKRDAQEKISPELINEAKELEAIGEFVEQEARKLRSSILKISQIIEKKYVKNYLGVVRYIGNSTIESDDKIFANVSALNGEFNLNCEIKGDLFVVNGKLKINRTAKVDGEIILINSSVIKDSLSNLPDNIFCGDLNLFDEPYNEYSDENQYGFNLSFPRFYFPGTDYPNGGSIRYNRVEGLYIGANSLKKYYWSGKQTMSIYGSLGYGFANHCWQGEINFDKWFGNENRTEFGGEYHNIVDSKDNWRISSEENSLASVFLHEDYKDFYKKDGWSVHLAQYFDKNFRLRLDLVQDNFESISNNTEWSLFAKDKIFRINPPIDSGRIKSIIIGFDHITVYGKDFVPNGWNISARYEIASGDYEYNRVLFDIRRYQKLSDDFRMNVRFMLGSSEKYLPKQRTFELGGVGSIPSLGFKEYEGNRVAMLNAELLFDIPHGQDFFPFFFFRGNAIVLFYDAGLIDMVDHNKKIDQGFEGFSLNNIKHDVGVAISFWRGSFRVGATFRLDKEESPKLFIRLSQPF